MATPANKELWIDALLQKHMIAERKIVKKHLTKFSRFQSKLHVQNSAMPAPLTAVPARRHLRLVLHKESGDPIVIWDGYELFINGRDILQDGFVKPADPEPCRHIVWYDEIGAATCVADGYE